MSFTTLADYRDTLTHLENRIDIHLDTGNAYMADTCVIARRVLLEMIDEKVVELDEVY